MPVLGPAQKPAPTTQFQAQDIVSQALMEIGAIDPSEAPSAPELSLGLLKLNRLIDAWNADRRMIWTVQFLGGPGNPALILVPNLLPHTIGPVNATFTVPQRPVKLLDANVILYNISPPVRSPLRIQDADWWDANRVYSITSSLPTDVYYEPDWPNGLLFIWPVPTTAYQLELEVWTALAQFFTPQDKVSLPPGYFDALVYDLAMSLAPSFQAQISPALIALRNKAMQRITEANTETPHIATQDAGMPKAMNPQPYWNYRLGRSNP